MLVNQQSESKSWFREASLGMFIHWGPYAQWGRGEQSLFRERLDQKAYQAKACRWNPTKFDADSWAQSAVDGGFRYAVLTTRHHDGYCLWDTQTTDYNSAAQSARQDLVRAYVDAFRKAGLRVGLYYSLADWRIPAYFRGPQRDPVGWHRFVGYCHQQVRELMTNYGKIDLLWFDGNFPCPSQAWQAGKMVDMIRTLQPEILINERLNSQTSTPGYHDPTQPDNSGEDFGDFSTPEHHITADPNRLWESCNTSTWRLWGYAQGEHWRTTEELLDMIVTAAEKGGNLLLNVGPKPSGRLPREFTQRIKHIGAWLRTNGEAIYNTQPGPVCEFITWGRQTVRGNNLYLIIRFWHAEGKLRLAGLQTPVKEITLLEGQERLAYTQDGDVLTIHDLPRRKPGDLFPVIRLECEGKPEAAPWSIATDGPWSGDPNRMAPWAAARGEGPMVNGTWKDDR